MTRQWVDTSTYSSLCSLTPRASLVYLIRVSLPKLAQAALPAPG